MTVLSDKLNCYLEGIKIPIVDINVGFYRNKITNASIKIVLGDVFDVKMFVNALIQVSYKESLGVEKLFFQGLIKDIIVDEANPFIWISADSSWSIFNFNRVKDYVAPKTYGIFNVLDEMTVSIGNELDIHMDAKIDNQSSFSMSQRYFYNTKEADDIKLNEPESFKLQFIMDKTPFAERFAFSLFEDIAYDNFILTQAHASRLNLLAKTKDSLRITRSLLELDNAYKYSATFTQLDDRFTGLKYKKAKFTETKEQIPISNFDKTLGVLPYQEISEKAKQRILNNKSKWESQVTIEQILSAYDLYCRQINLDPNLLIAQVEQESKFDPKIISRAGARGWAQFIDSTWAAYKPPGGSQYKVLDSIYAQCKYMAELMNEGKTVEEALGRYNGGGNWRQKSESRSYVLSVTNIYINYVNK